MTDPDRAGLAKLIVASLPKFGTWAYSFRDFETPYGKVGFRQLAILWILRYELVPPDELSPSRLAAIPNVQARVITRALAKLEASGFITRTVDARDSRVFRLAITEKGRHVSELVEQLYDDEVIESMAWLSDDQVAELRRSVELLDRIANDLERKSLRRAHSPARRRAE